MVEISSSPDTVKLKGASTVLNPLVSLEIPGSVINVSGARSDVKTTIDITEYLPDGVELVDASNATITVTVRIEAYASKTYQLPSNQIKINGLLDGLLLEFDDNKIPVEISGLKDDLESLSVDDLVASIDVSGLTAGEHQVELELKLDEEHYAYQPINVSIVLTQEEDSEESSQDNITEPSEQ